MKAFGKDKKYIQAGENLTNSGQALLNQVEYSASIDTQILAKTKKSV